MISSQNISGGHAGEKPVIAIMGATSHIAKGLINNFISAGGVRLYLFARNSSRVHTFLGDIGACTGDDLIVCEGYGGFAEYSYDAVINCVGLGTATREPHIYTSFFMVTEEFDNLVISYLAKSPQTLYINLSSGAVYGRDFIEPAQADTLNKIRVNGVTRDDFFLIAKLNSEAKHRAFEELNIVDIRVFSYFSRFADLTGKYFITELLYCLMHEKVFHTDATNIVRDYIHPDDLFSLMIKCLSLERVNTAFDAYSLRPIEKWEALDFFSSRYNLKYEVEKSARYHNVTGHKNVYYSLYRKAGDLDYSPAFSSLDTLIGEAEHILQRQSRGRAGIVPGTNT